MTLYFLIIKAYRTASSRIIVNGARINDLSAGCVIRSIHRSRAKMA